MGFPNHPDDTAHIIDGIKGWARLWRGSGLACELRLVAHNHMRPDNEEMHA